jgi:hypothetical protein
MNKTSDKAANHPKLIENLLQMYISNIAQKYDHWRSCEGIW